MMNASLSRKIAVTPPKLIIFDFDGTLVETEVLVEDTGHWRKAVRRTRGVRYDRVDGRVVGVMVHTHADGQVHLFPRRRYHDPRCACVDASTTRSETPMRSSSV